MGTSPRTPRTPRTPLRGRSLTAALLVAPTVAAVVTLGTASAAQAVPRPNPDPKPKPCTPALSVHVDSEHGVPGKVGEVYTVTDTVTGSCLKPGAAYRVTDLQVVTEKLLGAWLPVAFSTRDAHAVTDRKGAFTVTVTHLAQSLVPGRLGVERVLGTAVATGETPHKSIRVDYAGPVFAGK